MSLPAIGGLRFRLALKQILSFAALVSLLAWGAYTLVSSHIYSTVDDELQDRFIAVRSVSQIHHNSVTSLKEQADPEVREQFEKSLRYYQILDLDAKVVADSDDPTAFKFPVSTPARQALETGRATYETFATSGGTRVRVYNSPVEGQHRIRYLMRVGTSLAEADDTCRSIALFILAIIPMIVLTQSLISWVAAGSALRPLDQINAAVKQISIFDSSRRLPLSGAEDELERLTVTLNSMISAFQSSLQRNSEFLRNLSHELRQPLTVLHAETEQALRLGDLGEDCRKMMSKQLEHVELLSHTLAGLLATAQTDYTEIRINRQPEDLCELVKTAVDGVGLSAGERHVAVTGNLQPNVIGEFDAGHIWRLLLNLLDNAVKFTPANGRVDVSLTSNGQLAIITVADTGFGISAEDLLHVFDRNYRAPAAVESGIPGTGLGLSFARSIAEAHGGRIEVTSRKDEGSCFRVILPLHAYHGVPERAAPEQKQTIN
jgi:signal transduction histidine kinase